MERFYPRRRRWDCTVVDAVAKRPSRRERIVFISKIVWVVLLASLTAWIIISVGVSVGISQYHSYTRLERLPSTDEEIRHLDGSQASQARRSLNFFYRDLRAQSRRTFRRMSHDPEAALHLWKEWHEEWTADLETFGRSYSFTDEHVTANEHEKKLARIYEELVRVETEFHKHFLALGQASQEGEERLHSWLEESR